MRRRKGALSIIYNIVETQVSLSQQFRRSVRVGLLSNIRPPQLRKHGPQTLAYHFAFSQT